MKQPRETANAVAPREIVESVIWGDCFDPFRVLGLVETDDGLAVRTFQPDAGRVWILDGERETELEKVHDAGFFAAALGKRERFVYRLRLEANESQSEIEDPYRFGPVLGELDAHLILEGNHLNLYERLGAHPTRLEGVDGIAFAVWERAFCTSLDRI